MIHCYTCFEIIFLNDRYVEAERAIRLLSGSSRSPPLFAFSVRCSRCILQDLSHIVYLIMIGDGSPAVRRSSTERVDVVLNGLDSTPLSLG